MAKDLAWFPFFIEAWLGGTLSMSQGEIGAYLLALIQQWKSGDLQAIRDTPRAILTICRGKMSAEVRSKFISIEIDGQAYLRNARLLEIYNDQTAKHKQRVERAASGAQAKHKQSISRPQADSEQELSTAPSIQNKEERISLSTKRKSKSHSRDRVFGPVDERKDHPAIVAVKDTVKRYPEKENWNEIIATVGGDPDREKMNQCFNAWLRVSSNRANLTWLFDWYSDGIPAGKPNGKIEPPPLDDLAARGYGKSTFPGNIP